MHVHSIATELPIIDTYIYIYTLEVNGIYEQCDSIIQLTKRLFVIYFVLFIVLRSEWISHTLTT